jgi:hypothetical protein
LLGTTPFGTIERGSGVPENVEPRLIVIVRATSSTAVTSPADCPVPGSATSLSSPIRWSWAGNENVKAVERATGSLERSSRPARGSRSSSSSSSFMAISAK